MVLETVRAFLGFENALADSRTKEIGHRHPPFQGLSVMWSGPTLGGILLSRALCRVVMAILLGSRDSKGFFGV